MRFDLPLKIWHADYPPESPNGSLKGTSGRPEQIPSVTLQKSSSRMRSPGFTLIEIALAMAIFSFALVSMLGLLSVGLKNSRKASIQIAAANILSAIAADIQSADISNANNGEYVATTRKLKVKASVSANGPNTRISITPQTFTVDEACTLVNDPGNMGLLKTFRVVLSAASPNSGLAAISVQIRWPANIPDNKQPEGKLDSLVALPSP